MRSDDDLPTGEPLDVFTPLRRARDHATKSFIALVVASVSVFVVVLFEGQLLGWPRLDFPVRAEVVALEQVPNGTVVTFAGRGDGRDIRWSRFLTDSSWQMGQDIEGWVDEGGRFHDDFGLGWAGPPTFLFIAIIAPFVIFAARRLLALWIAWWDLHRPADEPHLGFVALIDDPSPRAWRPLLAVWWKDPTTGSRLPTPDGVFRADDETGGELSSLFPVRVWRAWIDTGRSRWMKPRWIGIKDRVLIPHRRAVFGRLYVRMLTRKAAVEGPGAMLHGPPDPVAARVEPSSSLPRHDFGKMLLWRLVAVLAVAVAAALLSGEGEDVTVTVSGSPDAAEAPSAEIASSIQPIGRSTTEP